MTRTQLEAIQRRLKQARRDAIKARLDLALREMGRVLLS